MRERRLHSGFTPLHPEGPASQSGYEGQTKIKSLRKPRLLRRGVTGFTLIELLIAVTLLVVIIAALITGFRSGLRTYDTGQEITGNLEELRSFLEMFQNDLHNCVYFTKGVQNSTILVGSGFKGDETSARFLTKRKEYIPAQGSNQVQMGYALKAVVYKVDRDNDDDSGKNKVVLKAEYDYADFFKNGFIINDPENKKENIVLRGFSKLTIEYFDYQVASGAAANSLQSLASWPPINDARTANLGIDIPAQVKIELELNRTGQGGNKKITRTVILPLQISEFSLYNKS